MAQRVTGTPEDGVAEPERLVSRIDDVGDVVMGMQPPVGMGRRRGASTLRDEAGHRAAGAGAWSDEPILPGDAIRRGTEDPEERLRRSSEAFLAALAAIEVMERQKLGLPAGDARRVGLARYIDELAIELLVRNQHETRLLAEAAGPPSCEPPPGYVALTDWQLAERSLRVAVRALRSAALASAGFEEDLGPDSSVPAG